MSPPRTDLGLVVTLGHFVLLCISLRCVRYLYVHTQKIRSMPGICFLLVWWLINVTIAYCLWGFRVAWMGSQTLKLRELVWFVPIKMTFMCWPLIVVAYWAAFAYRSERFKSEQLLTPSMSPIVTTTIPEVTIAVSEFVQTERKGEKHKQTDLTAKKEQGVQSQPLSTPWFIRWLKMKYFFPIMQLPYIPMFVSCQVTVQMMESEQMDQPVPDQYPTVIMYSFMFGFIYNLLLSLPALYMLIKVSLDDVYGLRNTLTLAIFDAAFWTNIMFWFGLYLSWVNSIVDIGTILAGALLTSQSNWVYRVTWNAYLNSRDTKDKMFYSITTVAPLPLTLSKDNSLKNTDMKLGVDIGTEKNLHPRDVLSYIQELEEEKRRGLFPTLCSHPLWSLLCEQDATERGSQFLQLCSKSLCTENVLAWKEIRQLALQWPQLTPEARFTRKRFLYDRFLGSSALWPLNLEAEVLGEIAEWDSSETIQDHDLFSTQGILFRVLSGVFTNLEQDTWKRYQFQLSFSKSK